MKHINLGTLEVSRIGLGTMGMSTAYTGAGSDDAESIRTIHSSARTGGDPDRHRRDLRASPDQLDRLDRLTPAAGEHHSEEQMRMIER